MTVTGDWVRCVTAPHPVPPGSRSFFIGKWHSARLWRSASGIHLDSSADPAAAWLAKPISNNPDARDIRTPALSVNSGIERLKNGRYRRNDASCSRALGAGGRLTAPKRLRTDCVREFRMRDFFHLTEGLPVRRAILQATKRTPGLLAGRVARRLTVMAPFVATTCTLYGRDWPLSSNRAELCGMENQEFSAEFSTNRPVDNSSVS
jgi:hypothetical protein